MITLILKKLKIVIFIIVLSTISKIGYCMIYPVGPVVDPLNVSGEGTSTFSKTANKIVNMQSTISDAINDAKRAVADAIAGILGGKRKPGKLAGSKKVSKSRFVDYNDETAVKKKIYELFWTYPKASHPVSYKNSDGKYVKDNTPTTDEIHYYERKATELYQDSLLEVWAATRGLQAELKNIKTDTQVLKESLTEDAKDSQTLWKNAYEAYKTYDALYSLIEEMTALRAQSIATRAIKYDIKPTYQEEEEEEEEKTIPLTTSNLLTFSTKNTFASQDLFKSAPEVEFTNAPFANSQEEVAELGKFEPAYGDIEKALEYHNTMTSFPQYKELFQKYEQMLAIHEKAKEMVQKSDSCTLKFLGRHYSNPEQLWLGKNIYDKTKQITKTDETTDWLNDSAFINTEYMSRGGLSGWAYQLFIVAKALKTLETEAQLITTDEKGNAVSTSTTDEEFTEVNDFATDEEGNVITQAPESEHDQDYMDKKAKEKEGELENDSNSGFSSKEEKEKAEDDIRANQKLYWEIGSLVINDLAAQPAEWNATLSGDTGVWSDQKIFYTQYLTKKYDNIKEYLTKADFSKITAEAKKVLLSEKEKYDQSQKGKAVVPEGGTLEAVLSAIASHSTNWLLSFDTQLSEKIKEMEKIIDDTKKEINNLPLNSFSPDNHQAFLDIHQNMFEKIKELNVEMTSLLVPSKSIVFDVMLDLFTNLSLSEEKYTQIDSDYFVGSSPVERDLKSPFVLPATTIFNPREVFYFDDIDWVNVGGKDGSFNAQRLLNYGSNIPAIWKQMLKDKAFVETDFDLDSALQVNEKKSLDNLVQIGKYPCLFSNGNILSIQDQDFDIIKLLKGTFFKYQYYPNDNSFNYSACLFEKSMEIGISNSFPLSLVQKIKNKYGSVSAPETQAPDKEELASELAMFLSSSNKFNTFANYVFKNANLIRNSKDSKSTPDDNFNNYILSQIAFNKNQIGDFLRVAEEEAEIKKTVDEIKAKIDVVKWGEFDEEGNKTSTGLYDALQELGFQVTDDFSLANDNDYNSAFGKLNDAKNSHIHSAQLVIDLISTINNDLAETRKDEYLNIIRALYQDSHARFNLTNNPPTKTELASKITEAIVNEKVLAEQKEEADKTMEDQINNFATPYCAAY